LTEIFAIRLGESWTHHFQLGFTKVFKFLIFAMVGPTQIFRNILWTHQSIRAWHVHVQNGYGRQLH